jgi:hypothetical protein
MPTVALSASSVIASWHGRPPISKRASRSIGLLSDAEVGEASGSNDWID